MNATTQTTKPAMNPKQVELLRHLVKIEANGNKCTTNSPTLRALVRRGCVVVTGSYERMEWNRVVATLATFFVTDTGKAAAKTGGTSL